MPTFASMRFRNGCTSPTRDVVFEEYNDLGGGVEGGGGPVGGDSLGKLLSRGRDSRSLGRLVACLLAMMSSIEQTGNPLISAPRLQASSKRSMPSGANTRSTSNGPFFSWTKSFP